MADKRDSKNLWKAISWNGSIIYGKDNPDRPGDTEFKTHFEKLLNPTASEPLSIPRTAHMYIPATDDAITPSEVTEAICSMKSDRSGGPSGIPPGVLRCLPEGWIISVALTFTFLFYTATFPLSWTLARLIVIFKKGSRMLCENYRGIAVSDTFAKLFDAVLCRRLERWYKPDREQAGAQKGRGCIEHILSLKLLMDYAISKHVKLFITFVDFSKAYDKVPRPALIHSLARLGCGYAMLMAVSSLYTDTKMILGAATITTTVGLRQGSPTSGFLFTLYINDLVREMKVICGLDDFLGWVHCLLLMDDTILLATTREKAAAKINVLKNFCGTSGMVINIAKTKFMVINGNQEDRQPIVDDDLCVKNCDSYTYLGAVFMQDGSPSTSGKEHMAAKRSYIMKFVSFLGKNCDFPFWVKWKVMDSALLSAILYGCEGWILNSAVVAQKYYLEIVKALLGVRTSTPNDTCLIELGLPSVTARVKAAQQKFIRKLIRERQGLTDDPFMAVWNLCSKANTKGARYLRDIMSHADHIKLDFESHRQNILSSTRTKSLTYVNLNPELSVHGMYRDADPPTHLGDPRQDNSARPVLVTLPTEYKLREVLQNAQTLSASESLKNLKLKKDQHPAIRKEWRRMFDSETNEKQKPENVVSNIVFDKKMRVITRDGVVIDRFLPHF